MGLRMYSRLLKKADGGDPGVEAELQRVIAAEDPAEFVDFILTAQAEDLEGLEPRWVSLLAKEMTRHAALLKPLVGPYGDIPSLMCPSQWESFDLTKTCHFPIKVMDVCWTLNMMIDEYFGLCYGREDYREGPDGSGERFAPGIKAHFAQMIKQKAGNGLVGVKKAYEWLDGMGVLQSHIPSEDSYAQGVVDLKELMGLNEVEEAQVFSYLTKQGF